MILSEIHMRDPFILKDDKTKKYYLYGTFKGDASNDFFAFESDDLINFQGPHRVLKIPDKFWGTQDFWAPEVHYYKGKYYFIATFKGDEHCRGCQIFISESPLGNFIEHSQIVTPTNFEALDGTLYIENDEPYLIFVHEWTQIKDGEVCVIKLSKDLKRSIGKAKTLFKASDASWSTNPDWAKFPHKIYVADGPFVVRDKQNKIIILWSAYKEGEYVTGFAYNNSESLFNKPFIQSETKLDIEDGGHSMIFEDFSNNTWLLAHVNNSKNERPKLFKVKILSNEIKVIN